jgi:thiol-disulfide isomerase/thioredoxin
MKHPWLFGLILGLTACISSVTGDETVIKPISYPAPASLADLGPAPELTNNTWLNVDAPLRLAGLRGKVVIIDMWTFGCINCQHVIPSLKEWHKKYSGQGLVIIGNHFPEFDYEADLKNLKDAVAKNGIEYAVAQDNDGQTWSAYNNHYWPTLYLIDKQGHIRYVHIGEGAYAETESAIQALLAE